MEEQNIEKLNVVEKKDNKKLINYFIIAGFIVELIVLFIIKQTNEIIAWVTILAWALAGLIFFGAIFLFFYFFNKKEDNLFDKLKSKNLSQPEPITYDEFEKLVDKIIFSSKYAQYLGKPIKEYVMTVGDTLKSDIGIHIAPGKFLEDGKAPIFAILMNLHFPLRKKAILKFIAFGSKEQYEVDKVAKGLATAPSIEPDKVETYRENPLLGTKEVIKETKHKHKEEKSENKEKENLES